MDLLIYEAFTRRYFPIMKKQASRIVDEKFVLKLIEKTMNLRLIHSLIHFSS